jgi:hypothetical protein
MESPRTSPPPREGLAATLGRILENPPVEGFTLGWVINSTGESAFGVLMALLCLPFLLPVTIPGTSTPFGIALILLGLQVAVASTKPWLPRRLRRWRLPRKITAKLLSIVAWLFKRVEKIVRPRLAFMQGRPAVVAVGVAIAIDGFFLMLPWPPVVPLTNTIPAWLALIKILGLTERDGAFLLAGVILTAAVATGAVLAIIFGWGAIAHHLHLGGATRPAH